MAPDMEVLCGFFDAVRSISSIFIVRTWTSARRSGRLSSGILPEPPLRFIGYLDVVLLAPSRVGAVAVVARLLRLRPPCSIPNMGV